MSATDREALLAELSARFGVRVLDVTRFDGKPGHETCDGGAGDVVTCAMQRPGGPCSPTHCGRYVPPLPQRWQLEISAFGPAARGAHVVVANGTLRNPRALTTWLAARFGTRALLTAEDGRQIVRLMHEIHELRADVDAAVTR